MFDCSDGVWCEEWTETFVSANSIVDDNLESWAIWNKLAQKIFISWRGWLMPDPRLDDVAWLIEVAEL